MKLLVKAGADVNCVNSEGKTAVMLASSRGYVEIVKFLVGKGSDVNFVPGHNQLNPLLYASCNGHLKIVKCLIKAGADVNFIRNEDHSTPLLLAASNGHTNIKEILVQSGASVNSTYTEDATPLMKAASYGHIKSLQTLISAGADVNHSLDDGWSVLMSAASNGHLSCLQYKIQVQDPRYFRHYPYHKPIGSHQDREKIQWNKYCSKTMAQFRCPRKDVQSNASTVSSSDCVKLLVKSGADVNKATVNGWTALHLASLDGYADVVKSLLDLGANVNATSAINWTPLIAAIVGNQYQCARALIRAGANVNAMVQIWHSANWEAKTALGFAVDLDTVDIVQLLLHYGVQVDHMSLSNCTNLELCSKWLEMLPTQ